MGDAAAGGRVRRAPRRWSITPVPAGRRDDGEILREIEPEPLAVALWRAVRDVRLWADVPPASRGELQRRPTLEVRARNAAAVACAATLADPHAAGLVTAVPVLASLMERPAAAEPAAVAAACAAVSTWAEEREAPAFEVAVQFAEAAACVEPEVASHAVRAARISRRMADHARAQVWYERGITLARRSADVEPYIRGYLGYGRLLSERGRHDAARRALLKAARRAYSAGRRTLAAEAHHDLLLAYLQAGDHPRALRHARYAFLTYPLRHPRFPLLAHDAGLLLINVALAAQALPLLRVALLGMPAWAQPLGWATLAYAAAATRDDLGFDSARRMAQKPSGPGTNLTAAVLISLAEAHRLRQDWTEAEQLAAEALVAARKAENLHEVHEATQILDSVALRNSLGPLTLEPSHPELIRFLAEMNVRLARQERARTTMVPTPDLALVA